MLRIHKVTVIAAMLALAACSTADTHKSTKKPAAKPAASATVASSSNSEASSPMVLGPSSTGCDYPSGWVGKKIDRNAVKATGHVVRILHPSDPATMDFNPNRLNVIIDKDDIVTEVKCG